MIFNKDNNGTSEIANIATWTADHNYQHIAQALKLAKHKLLKIIDKKTYAAALEHYKSENFQKASPTEAEARLDSLVVQIQT